MRTGPRLQHGIGEDPIPVRKTSTSRGVLFGVGGRMMARYMYRSMGDLSFARSQSCGKDDKEMPAVGLLPMGDGSRNLWDDADKLAHCVCKPGIGCIESLS